MSAHHDLPADGTGPTPAADQVVASPTRRDLLRRAGTVAAGAAVVAVAGGATMAATTDAASAATGGTFVLGSYNRASNTTHLSYDAGPFGADFSGGAFVVSDGLGGGSVYSASIHGLANGNAQFGMVGEAWSSGGAGVFGIGQGAASVGVLAQGTRAPMWLAPQGAAPTARNDLHGAGELVEDATGNLWLCVTGGTPGYWRKLAGPATAGALHVLNVPKRVYDSRAGEVPVNVKKGRLIAEARVIDAKANGSGVPAGATAIAVNLTVTNTSASGFLAVYRNGIPYPGTSALDWTQPNSSIANGAIIAVDALAQFVAYCPYETDLIVDVNGYYL